MSKGTLRRKREHRKAGQEKWERSRVQGVSGDQTLQGMSRGPLPEGVLQFPQGKPKDRDMLCDLPPLKPTKDRDAETAQLLRGVLAHLETLLEKAPWIPFPQNACTFTFGRNRAPLPLGALALLWGHWPMATGRCSDCESWVLATAFGGGLSRGKILSCCPTCGRVYYRLVGGLGSVGADVAPYLKGTEFYVATGIFWGVAPGSRRPLREALKDLGVADLANEDRRPNH